MSHTLGPRPSSVGRPLDLVRRGAGAEAEAVRQPGGQERRARHGPGLADRRDPVTPGSPTGDAAADRVAAGASIVRKSARGHQSAHTGTDVVGRDGPRAAPTAVRSGPRCCRAGGDRASAASPRWRAPSAGREALFRLLEIAAEEACGRCAPPASRSSRLEPGSVLGAHHRQRRRPRARRGALAGGRDLHDRGVRRPRAGRRRAADLGLAPSTTRPAPQRARAARASSARAARSARRSSWTASCGASSTRPGTLGEPGFDQDDVAYLEALIAILAGARVPLAAGGVAGAAGLPRPADRPAEPAGPRRARRARPSTCAPGQRARSPWSPSTSTGSSRSTTSSATSPATS